VVSAAAELLTLDRLVRCCMHHWSNFVAAVGGTIKHEAPERFNGYRQLALCIHPYDHSAISIGDCTVSAGQFSANASPTATDFSLFF